MGYEPVVFKIDSVACREWHPRGLGIIWRKLSVGRR